MAKVLDFLNTIFVKGFWETFCVNWVWKTFFVAWIWQTFCQKWVWEGFLKKCIVTPISSTKFWKDFVVEKFWNTFCIKWIRVGFFKNIVGKKLKFEKWKGYVYLAPALVLLAIFTVWPIINTVRIAFLEDYNLMLALNPNHPGFEAGFSNFSTVVLAPKFKTCLENTIVLCVLTVPISTFLALLIAVALNSIKAFQKFLQTIFFLPYVTNSIAIGMVFAAMFNMTGAHFGGGEAEVIASPGIINNILGLFGIDPINWINQNSSHTANVIVMVIYIVWNALPFKILVLLGGLQSVNKQYYEAAKIDGTPRWRVFTKITVPLLSPMITYVVITGFIGGFKEYSSIVGIFGDGMGPGGNGSMNTMVGYIYSAIERRSLGVASAAALILFGIIFVVTMINLYVSKKKTHY